MQNKRISVSVTLKPQSKRFDPSMYVKEGVEEDDVLDIKETFDLFDSNGDGMIDPAELIVALEELGPEGKNTTIYQIFQQNLKSQQSVGFDRFFELMTSKMTSRNSREDLAKVFRLFIKDGSDRITANDLLRIADELGEGMSDKDIYEIFERTDVNNDGYIQFEEFYRLMSGQIMHDSMFQ